MKAERDTDGGFTLIEVLIALLILGIVLTALGPAFYGALRATASTNLRSVADTLAVAADEQIRSYPYYEVGFPATPTNCPTSAPDNSNLVVLAAGIPAPLASLSATRKVGSETYSIVRCVYWVDSSATSQTNSTPLGSQAYKRTVVTVSWPAAAPTFSVSETSDIYPGGEGAYTIPADNYPPQGTIPTPAQYPPSAPATPTAANDQTNPTTVIDVTWQAPTGSPTPIDHYVVQYSSVYGGSGSITATCDTCYTQSPKVGSGVQPGQSFTWQTPPLTPGSWYYFQVLAVASDGTTSLPSGVVSMQTTGTSNTCQVNNVFVTPSTGVVNGSGQLVDSQGNPLASNSFSLFVNATSQCNNGNPANTITVAYYISGSLVQATLTRNGGSLTGAATPGAGPWSVGNHTFTVYKNGQPYNPLAQQQVDVCQEQGTSGQC